MTAIATQTINLDLRPHFNRQNNCIVYCSQYDNDLRNVVVNIADAGTAVNVSTYTIYIEGTKPDKKGFSYELTDIGGTVSNNVVTFPLQLQMTACAGITNAELVFYSGDDRIGSSNFILAVEKAGLADDIDVSETDIPAYVDGAQQAAAAAAQSADDAEDAKDTAVSVAASIPEDYTTLSNDVDDLKSALSLSTTPVWVQGKGINTLGQFVDSGARIATQQFIYIGDADEIEFNIESGYRLSIAFYSAASESSFVAVRYWLTGKNRWTKEGNYIRLTASHLNDSPAMTVAEGSNIVITKPYPLYDMVVTKHDNQLNALNRVYFNADYEVTEEAMNVFYPTNVKSGDFLKFTNNSTAQIAIYLLDSEGNQASVATPLAAGANFYYKASADAVQIKLYSPAIGTLNMKIISGELYELETHTLENDELVYSAEIKSSIEAVQTVLAASNQPMLTLAVFTDLHHDPKYPNDPTDAMFANINALNKRIHFDGLWNLGDSIDGQNQTQYEAEGCLSEVVTYMYKVTDRAHSLMGNHDDNVQSTWQTYGGLDASNRLTMLELNEVLWKGSNKEVHNPNRWGDYYIDFEAYDIRVICVSADYVDFKVATQNWLTNTALNTTHKVLVFSHCATKAEWGYMSDITNGDRIETPLNNFIANGGTVIALIHGHTHGDMIETDASNRFTEVAIGCAKYETPSSGTTGITYQPRNAHDYRKILFDIVCVDQTNRKLHFIRCGAGTDRYISY